MSKTNKKYSNKYNDYRFEEEDEEYYETKSKVDKRKQRRIERALKTKDLTTLIENEEYINDDWD